MTDPRPPGSSPTSRLHSVATVFRRLTVRVVVLLLEPAVGLTSPTRHPDPTARGDPPAPRTTSPGGRRGRQADHRRALPLPRRPRRPSASWPTRGGCARSAPAAASSSSPPSPHDRSPRRGPPTRLRRTPHHDAYHPSDRRHPRPPGPTTDTQRQFRPATSTADPGHSDEGPLVQLASRELQLAADGTPEQKQAIGDPDHLPRPLGDRHLHQRRPEKAAVGMAGDGRGSGWSRSTPGTSPR